MKNFWIDKSSETERRSVDFDSLWKLLDAADTLAVDDGDLDVSPVTPADVPGVFHEPVVQSRVGVVAPADDEHGVVKVYAAWSVVQDARLVELEA